MAIWPFGRKGKRPRSQMKASDSVDRDTSLHSAALSPVLEHAAASQKPSRKRSKRDKHRSSPPRAAVEPLSLMQRSTDTPMGFAYSLDNHTSLSSIGQDNFLASRATPTLQKRASTTGKGSLRKRLSRRSARDLQREQEIRAMSSSPPAMHRHPAATLTNLTADGRLGPGFSSRHADHQFSNHSLPIDSRSSLSDHSDCDNSRYGPPRSLNPSANSMRKDIKLDEEEDLHSRRRVAELADDLDAPALRELMERDRRRREKKRQENQERIQRRLQRRAERDRERDQERNMAGSPTLGLVENLDDLRGRDRTPSPTTSSKLQPATEEEGTTNPRESVLSHEPSGSWLRSSSKESLRKSNRFSDISTHVIGNIDDRSVRAGKTGCESAQHYPLQEPQQYTTPQNNNAAPEALSDLPRTEKSEKRLSDHSGRRMGAWMTFFSRGSPRRKASRDLDAPPSEFSNTSRESFARSLTNTTLQAHTPAVPIPIPERSFLRIGGASSNRSQSKFTEHLGDYPISPPDSRVQSPVPVPAERSTDAAPVRESTADVHSQSPTPHEMEDVDRAWDANSGMLSQSLASIDSEGSWMSGKFLRRISQNTANTAWRNSAGKPRLSRYDEAHEGDDVAGDEYFNQLTEESLDQRQSAAGVRRASSSAMGLDLASGDSDNSSPAEVEGTLDGNYQNGITESWRGGLARQPTVVRPAAVRTQSREIVLTDIDMLDATADQQSPISPVSQGSDEPVEIQRAQSVDYGRGHKHARQISAGSAKLLDIPPRSSVDSTKGSVAEQF